MEIEKLHLICPKCLQINDQDESTSIDERKCTKCKKISHSADFFISTFPIRYKADEDFPSVFHKIKGDNWSLMIKPRHYKNFFWNSFCAIVMILFGIFSWRFSLLFGLIFIGFGSYLAWPLVVRFLGKFEIEFYKNRLSVFWGIGLLGSLTHFRWQEITAIRPYEQETGIWALSFFTREGREQKTESKDISLDLSVEQIQYVERFLYQKLEIRDKNIAQINSESNNE